MSQCRRWAFLPERLVSATSEGDVLVVAVTAQLVGGLEKLGFEAEAGATVLVFGVGYLLPLYMVNRSQ